MADNEIMDFGELLGGGIDNEANETISSIPVEQIDFYEHNRTVTDEECKGLYEQLSSDDWKLIQPITVIPNGERYTCVAGERRLRSFRIGKRETINCIVRTDLDERKARELNFNENEQRENEDFIERLIRHIKFNDDFKIKQKEAAKRLGLSESQYSEYKNHLVRVKDFSLVYELYQSEFKDKTTIIKLVKLSDKNIELANEILTYAANNDCRTRKFFNDCIKAKKLLTPEDAAPVVVVEKDESQIDIEDVIQDSAGSEGAEEQVSQTDSVDVDNQDLDVNQTGKHDIGGDNATQFDDEEFEEPEEESVKSPVNVKNKRVRLSGIDVEERSPSKAEIAVSYEGESYFLETKYTPVETDKILLVNISGKHILAETDKCTLQYVM